MPRKTLAVRRAGRRAGRFNEAAARCRGKRAATPADPDPAAASMRPRPDAAENLREKDIGPSRPLGLQ